MLADIRNGLVVSCQALEDEPLHSPFIMGRIALAAELGGAKGIRANSAPDIAEIKSMVKLPVIGIVKRDYPDSEIYITATMKEIDELAVAGADMIAMDATNRVRPEGISLERFLQRIKQLYPDMKLIADVSSLEEGKQAEALGFDCVSTTLYGYTKDTSGRKLYEDDFSLLKQFISEITIPVIAEGNVMTPEMAGRCLQLGAHAVVVGGAITRPQNITRAFVDGMKN